MVELANTIFADGPSGAPHDPPKYQIRAWGTWLESLANLAFTNGLVYDDLDDLEANLVPAANTPALVIGDPTPGNDGLYMKVGATGTGSWSQLTDFVPGAQIVHAVDVGAGTPNAIIATTDLAVSSSGSQIVRLDIFEANTGTPVTVSGIGSSLLTIKTASGNDVAIGGLTAGPVLGFVSGSTFRLLSDQASAAILAQVEAAATAAAASETNAAASALAAATSETNAEFAETNAVTAAEASGNVVFYDTKADADAALGGLVNNQIVEVFVDETQEDMRTRYRVEAGVLVFKLALLPGFLNTWTFASGYSVTKMIAAIDAGRAIVITSDVSSITLTTEPQAQSFLGALDGKILKLGGLLTVNLPANNSIDIAAAIPVRSRNIKLLGAATVSTTISSIQSVTGAAGAWVVTANVASAAGIAVGDVLNVTAVTPGVQLPGTYTTRPKIGALQMQYFQNGALSLAGTVGTVENSVLPTYVSSGDFLIADGRVKRMLNITASGFTVDAANAPPKDYIGKQYWYTMRISAVGTVTVNGTTVTGTSTTFTQRVNKGDLIAFAGYGIRKIASVDSDTQLTLTATHPTIASGVQWGVITAGEMHEGAWVVTAVSGNQVTWTNTAKTSYGPPVKLIDGGTVTALKTVLKFSATSGLIADDVTLEMDRIGMTGTGGAGTVAFDGRGVGAERSGKFSLGLSVGVVGFHYGSRIPTGGALYAEGTCWGGQTTRAHDFAEAGMGYLGEAVVAGSGGIGVFLGGGCYARLASARIHGHALQGFRQEVGSSAWADFATIGHNLGANILEVGGVHVHVVGCRSFGSGADGYNGQNGGYGRGSGFTALCNADDGIDIASGHMEMNQTISMGNGDTGAVMARGNLSVEESGFGFNGDKGLYVLTAGKCEAGNAQFIGNVDGIVATGRAKVYAPNAGFDDNSDEDCESLTGGFIDITGHGGAASFNPPLNQKGADGSLVTNGSLRDTGWTAMTGAADEATAFDTATVTTAQLAQRVKALQDMLTTKGEIGA